MGSFNFTDNLGVQLSVGDHVGYIHKNDSHYRIHSGIVKKLCEKRVWIEPDDDFSTDVRNLEITEYLYKDRKLSKYDKWYCAPYGKVVKIIAD